MKKSLITVVCCVVLIGGGLWLVLKQSDQPAKNLEGIPASVQETRTPVPSEKVIDYGKLRDKSDKSLTELMEERKAPYGIEKGVDMVVKPDESIKVGQETVQMQEIIDEVRLKRGEILEIDLVTGARQVKPDEYGIHVVQPGENIWDIHFELLKDYYDNKGIQLSQRVDEPDSLGFSSGVGKILKFSEDMVYIYNLKERKLETNLDLIYPLGKIVVYNMGHIFALLDRINYTDVQRIVFDGKTLWLPAER
jgi:predicted RNA-binding protein